MIFTGPEIYNRKVGPEASRTFVDKLDSGFWDVYCQGKGLDIGFSGDQPDKHEVVPILPTAIGVGLDYPGYDGITLPFENESQGYVYNSHVFEHVSDRKKCLQEWFRVLKIYGHLIIVVPHQMLYERRKDLPSQWNADHKVFLTPAKLLKEIEDALEPNTYRVRFLEDGDSGYDYSIPLDKHPAGAYEITLCIQKIIKPTWELA